MRIVLLCLLLVLAKASWADVPAARVNGVEIGVTRLERYFSEYLTAQGRALTSIRNPGLYKRLRDQALDELIDKELLWQEARRQGIAISDAQVSAHVGEVEAAFGSPAIFERRLAEAGFDRAQYTEYTRQDMAAQQVYAQLSAVDAPSQVEVEAFYAANRETLQGAQNQSDNPSVIREQGLVLARAALIGKREADARRSVRQRLRDAANVEVAD
ncbi:SurA N-terminal domain-containing protein [Pseudomonas monteilii]|jgi:peptidyl-prolyl cis-trans isomerase C|uniref:peptidylprolyl isomerase n=2 Tax=Pseudomonas putida group TaxID=136845 RepID=A0AAE6V2D1_9PSED|nr:MULTISPECIES: SurA N-terminal domain-containing protein [Pseudomonas]MBB3272698.1 peptidyl-prolyl cis-trans isomerase C [Pseudomonas sp. OG7]MBH3397481.1 SurA N-terminal domain-containing protein [Pseudomonas monteilii]MBH3457344.1 SurA N-terminal domain-containing protein [Pseudomonas monteilii]MCJ7854480.1 SurA N-terminal domain-containing protein [Pseudomonas monteilii]MDD2124535.1 SurA N-terminal domain-containing protein [Pseudomonas monteilii]